MNTSILFEPIQIGKIELKNRIAMSPMNMGLHLTGTLMEGKIEAVAKTKMGELLIRSK